MSVLFRGVQRSANDLSQYFQGRGASTGSVSVSPENALRMSAVWAALRLRADMVSNFPVELYRKVGDLQVSVPKPSFFVSPQGDTMRFDEWMYSGQINLDRVGNNYGIVTARDGAGKPAAIQLVDHATVTLVQPRSAPLYYRIAGTDYAAADVWHERQFTIPGLPVGLSPVAYAAWSIGSYQSAQQFGLEWFANGAQVPSGHFRNTKKQLTPAEASTIKDRYKSAVQDRDVLVTGDDWEFKTVDSGAKDAQFLETQAASETDIARYFGVPGDLIDVATKGQSVTYANISQRNLQFLIMNLQPTVTRRERALSTLTAEPRFVKLNTEAILRMDPQMRAAVNATKIASKQLTPDEAREKDNLPPLTEEQWLQFDRMNSKGTPGMTNTMGATA